MNIHKVEKLGFFITMWIISIVVGMTILVGVIKLIDLFNK
jgi:hypothetical protein